MIDHGDDTTSTADLIFELLSTHAESATITRTRLRVMALERLLARRRARRGDRPPIDVEHASAGQDTTGEGRARERADVLGGEGTSRK